jgi:hypothetical protein
VAKGGQGYANSRSADLIINNRNVASLKVAWTFSTGLTAGHEGAPWSQAARCTCHGVSKHSVRARSGAARARRRSLTAMANLGVTDSDLLDIVAYLYTLR